MRTSREVARSRGEALTRTLDNPQENWEILGQSKARQDLLHHEKRGNKAGRRLPEKEQSSLSKNFGAPVIIGNLGTSKRHQKEAPPDEWSDGQIPGDKSEYPSKKPDGTDKSDRAVTIIKKC